MTFRVLVTESYKKQCHPVITTELKTKRVNRI